MWYWLKKLSEWLAYPPMQESDKKLFFKKEHLDELSLGGSSTVVGSLTQAAIHWGCERIDVKLDQTSLIFSADIKGRWPRFRILCDNPIKCLENLARDKVDFGEYELCRALLRAFSFEPAKIFIHQGPTTRGGSTSRALEFNFDLQEINQIFARGGIEGLNFSVERARNVNVSTEELYLKTADFPSTLSVYLNDVLLFGLPSGRRPGSD